MSLASLLAHTRTLLLLACALALGGCGIFGIDSSDPDYCEENPENCEVAPETAPETDTH